jgi:hypothetical protein
MRKQITAKTQTVKLKPAAPAKPKALAAPVEVKAPTPAAAKAKPAEPKPQDKPKGKSDIAREMMQGKGATLQELVAATNWVPSSVQDWVSRSRGKGVKIVKDAETGRYTLG